MKLKSTVGLFVGPGCMLFSPCPVQANVSIVLGLPGDGMAVRKEELKIGIFEMVVAARVYQSGCLRLRRGQTLGAMREHLDSELQFLVDLPFDEKSTVWIVPVISLWNDGVPGTSVEGPWPLIFFNPEGHLYHTFPTPSPLA